MVWRRLLVRSDSSIADLHYSLQLAFGWSDAHLHRFPIHGKDYGVSHMGGTGFGDDPTKVLLSHFRFRLRERFVYEYDFGDLWVHEVRLEQRLDLDPKRRYPVCTGGGCAAPPEDCGGPWAYLEQRRRRKLRAVFGDRFAAFDLWEADKAEDGEEEEADRSPPFDPDAFDRRALNARLGRFARGDRSVLDEAGEIRIG